MDPGRYDRKGSDHFDSDLATYGKGIDVVVSADGDFADFLSHPVIENFNASRNHPLNVVRVDPKPEALDGMLASIRECAARPSK
jgi:hypothetical protein